MSDAVLISKDGQRRIYTVPYPPSRWIKLPIVNKASALHELGEPCTVAWIGETIYERQDSGIYFEITEEEYRKAQEAMLPAHNECRRVSLWHRFLEWF